MDQILNSFLELYVLKYNMDGVAGVVVSIAVVVVVLLIGVAIVVCVIIVVVVEFVRAALVVT